MKRDSKETGSCNEEKPKKYKLHNLKKTNRYSNKNFV